MGEDPPPAPVPPPPMPPSEETPAREFFRAVMNERVSLVETWIRNVLGEAEDGEKEWIDVEHAFWTTWARVPVALSLDGDLLSLFPAPTVFTFDVCKSPVSKPSVIKIASPGFWAPPTMNPARQCLRFSKFHHDSEAPRDEMALEVMLEFYRATEHSCLTTDEDVQLFDGFVQEMLGARAQHEESSFARRLASDLLRRFTTRNHPRDGGTGAGAASARVLVDETSSQSS